MAGEGLLAGRSTRRPRRDGARVFAPPTILESEGEDYERGRRREIARKRDILAIEDDAYWS